MSQSNITTKAPRYKVETLSGEEIALQSASEKNFYEKARDKYLEQYTFTHANDVRTLDRLLAMEVQMHRYQYFALSGMYYDGVELEPKEEGEIRRAMKELGPQIVEAQNTLGVTKSQRDKQTVDSVGGYIMQLQQAAKAHGVMREKQLGKALELTKELFSLTGAFMRSNDDERRKLGFESAQDIVDWIEQYMRPEFDAIDEHFRNTEAKFYRRNL